jgi:hypothetical protein
MRIIAERHPQEQPTSRDSDPFITVSQTDSGKYELSVAFPRSGSPTTNVSIPSLRFRAKTIEELVPLSASSVDDKIRQWIRDLVYDSEDLEYTRMTDSELGTLSKLGYGLEQLGMPLTPPTSKSAQFVQHHGDATKETKQFNRDDPRGTS